MNESIDRAAEAISRASALLITAGAGMGVDSGLPDFRGTQGFWRAYPPYAKLGLDFADLASPRWFRDDPALAWGFYGHRLNLYRTTLPHRGFAILKRWGELMPDGALVFTSNVDGQFQRAGFDPERIVECHGAIDRLQCLARCGVGLFPAPPEPVDVDEASFRAHGPLPSCPRCGALARPNILMFGDGGWDGSVADDQERRFDAWVDRTGTGSRVIVECGAGRAIPTVRWTSEMVARTHERNVLIRINPREPDVPAGPHVSLPMGAAEALTAIDSLL